MTGHQHETVPPHVAGRVRHQRDRRLRRRGGHADPDLPDLRTAHDAGPEPEDGRHLHRRVDRPFLRPAPGVRGNAFKGDHLESSAMIGSRSPWGIVARPI